MYERSLPQMPQADDPDNDVAGPGSRFRDVVDPDVTGPVDAYLEHRGQLRQPVVGTEQELHGVAHRGVDDLDADAEVVAVIGERDGGVVARHGHRAAGGTRTPISAALSPVRSSLQKPMWCRFECSLQTQTEPGTSSMSSRCGCVDRVAHRGGEHEIPARAVAVVDRVEAEDRSPGDADVLGELRLRRGEVGDDDADVVVRRQGSGAHGSR